MALLGEAESTIMGRCFHSAPAAKVMPHFGALAVMMGNYRSVGNWFYSIASFMERPAAGAPVVTGRFSRYGSLEELLRLKKSTPNSLGYLMKPFIQITCAMLLGLAAQVR